MNSMLPSTLTSSNTDQQKELLIYFQNLEQNQDGWKIALNELTNNRSALDDSSIFFYFKIIECYIKNRYESDVEANKFLIKQYVFNYFVVKKYDYQSFLLNKYASVVNELFRIEYPSGNWSTFFQDYLTHCNDKESSMLFLRILDQINTDIGEREHIITPKEIEKSTIIKDLMRDNAVNLIVEFWFSLVNTYYESEPAIVCYCLTIMGKYVSWIDINLVINDSRMTNLLNLFYNNQYRMSVLDCFCGILHKGMDAIAKATFIEQFCQLQCINDLFANDYNKDEQQFVIKLAKFFNKIGIELIDSFKRLKPSNPKIQSNINQLNLLFAAIDNKFLILCKFLSNDDLLISVEVHQFARDYIQLIKNLNKQNDKNQFVISENRIQEIILVMTKILIKSCKYPLDYEFSPDELEDEQDNEFDGYRKSCNVLLENLNQLNREFFSQFITNVIIEPTIKSTELKKVEFNELEISLYFLKCVGDSLGNGKDNKKLVELLEILITNSIVDYPHYSITIMYFEIICKYDKQFSSQLSEYMSTILASFIDKLKSPSIALRSKVTNLFNRFVKSNLKMKNNKKFLEFAEEIIGNIEPIIRLDYYLSYKGKTFREFNPDELHIKANRDNHLLLYESISYLIIMNSQMENEQKAVLIKKIFIDTILENEIALDNLLQNVVINNKLNEIPLMNKTEFDKQVKIICEDLVHLINSMIYSLKAFVNTEVLKFENLQNIYLELFNRFAKLLSLNLEDEFKASLQQPLCHYLNRIIVCFNESEILPILPLLIKSVLLPESYFNTRSVGLIQETVSLINQIVAKYNKSWLFHQNLLPFLTDFFLPFVSHIFNLTNSGNLNDEEKGILQKSYFNFISMITNNVFEIIKKQSGQTYEQILITLTQGLAIDDLSVQKTCLSILKKMVEKNDELSKLDQQSQLTNGNGLVMSSLFKCVYSSVIPKLLDILIKIEEQNQIVNEITAFLIAVQDARGCSEFGDFLNQYYTQNFNFHADKISELSDAFWSKDLNLIKRLFKEFRHI